MLNPNMAYHINHQLTLKIKNLSTKFSEFSEIKISKLKRTKSASEFSFNVKNVNTVNLIYIYGVNTRDS